MSNRERILCAANYYDDGKKHVHQPPNLATGYVVLGFRHCSAYSSYYAIKERGGAFETADGFLTSTNRFVSREEAYQIALAAGQISPKVEDDRLFSEDLY